jgi:lysophospholipase L1-like esterase
LAQDNTTNAPAAPPMPSPAPAAAAAPAPPPAPASPTRADNARYLADPMLLTDCQARLDAFANKPCDIIFIGDSITAFWLKAGKAIWDAHYAPLHALDFGIGGDKTQNVLWRLNNMSLQDLKPKVAVVHIGTNNNDCTPHEIADGVKAVLATTQLTFPGVKIILVSIMPNTRADDTMKEANRHLRGLADNSSVFYLDLEPLMPAVTTTGPDGKPMLNYKGLGPDGLHPDASGYQIWADAMDPLLHKLLAQ